MPGFANDTIAHVYTTVDYVCRFPECLDIEKCRPGGCASRGFQSKFKSIADELREANKTRA